ncbi:conserved hypothetical protein [Haloferula helveola]|uniref:DUF4340 domain-containing protein n=1 Tax=Haloferula helveola TaxID=490095 RepID=A0ABN6H9X3_9BACT|nr:conserved hypothetical protein [Haloferula helveola]
MNQRQVIVLWIIALVLVGSLVAVNSTKSDGYQSATERSRGETLLADFEPSEVASIVIKQGDETVSLSKKDGQWTVAERDNYPANASSINELLRTIDEVEVTQGIEADPEFAPRFGMDPSAEDDAEKGVDLVMGNDAGTELAQLTFGKNLESASDPMSPFGGGGSTGRFVRNHSDPSGIYVTSELFPNLSADPSAWLDEDFLKVEKIQTIAVSQPGKVDEVAWKITRDDEEGDFLLEGKKDNEQLDTTALNPLKNLFSYARFEDVVPAAEVEAAWDKEQRRQAVIETFEGFTYNVTFGPEKSETTEGEDAQPQTSYLMRVTVTAKIPEQRKAEEGESEEDAKKKKEAFDTRKKTLEEKLETAKQLEGRTYRVTKFTVDALAKDRVGLIKSAPPATTGAPGATTPPMGLGPIAPGAPGPGTATPPRRPARAVTPPIAIPPRPTEEEPDKPEAPEQPAPPETSDTPEAPEGE